MPRAVSFPTSSVKRARHLPPLDKVSLSFNRNTTDQTLICSLGYEGAGGNRDEHEEIARPVSCEYKAVLIETNASRRWACDPQSPLAQSYSNASLDLESSDEGTGLKTFIGDFPKSADYCQNPDLLNYVSSESNLFEKVELLVLCDKG